MALLPLPQFISLKSGHSDGGYLCYLNEPEELAGYVRNLEEYNVWSELVKIEVETARVNRNYVHLRFVYTNKYWAVLGERTSTSSRFIVCASDQPEEDTSKWYCTLFEPIMFPGTPSQWDTRGDRIALRHVQSGRFVRMYTTSSNYRFRCAYTNSTSLPQNPFASYSFFVVDWDALVIMPRHVTFRGSNDMYLKSISLRLSGTNREFHQFSSDDWNEAAAAYEVTMNVDGYLRIFSGAFQKFWRRSSPNWIWGDSTDNVGNDIDTLFWPVKANDVDGQTIGLRNAGNNRFCSNRTAERMTDCLNAELTTVAARARLIVEELVFQRDIIRVVYHFNHARIFNERVEVVGEGTARNPTQQESSMTISVSFEDSSSRSFSSNLSISAGVTSTITAGIPFISEASISVSYEISTSFEWGRETTETRMSGASLQVVVPPMSIAGVNYVATRGTCNIPFSYTQRDRRSSDGSLLNTLRHDGIYTGANFHSFHFDQLEIQPL